MRQPCSQSQSHLTSVDVNVRIGRSKTNLTLTDFTLHFCCCFTELLYSLFIPLLDNFTCMKSVIETLYSDVLFAKLQSHAHICKLSFRK